MDFKTYLFSMPVSDRIKFAERCGTTKSHLQNIAYGYKECREKLAISIERESFGMVCVEEMRPDVDWWVVRKRGAQARKAA